MRLWLTLAAALVVAACGSTPPPAPAAPPPPPPAPAPEPPAADEEKDEGIPDTATDVEEEVSVPTEPASPAPPSTASFEQATATPEPVVAGDDRLHLTDNQLSGPMRGVLAKCKVPPNVKVTIKTAVQFGRAIGVTVIVDLPKVAKAKAPKKPTKKSKDAAKAQAKLSQRITTCADHAVRALSWPPSRRRDAFTTTF